MSASLQQCYDMLHKTGGAFVVTANIFDKDLRDAVCVFYLVIRAVDTFEDDLTIPFEVRFTNINSFPEHLRDPTWRYTESQDRFSIVLEQFPTVSQALRELPEKYRDIIMERSDRISKGMARFLGREMITVEDLNEYTVAVGSKFTIGLCRLFVASGLEDEREAWNKRSINEFCIFLRGLNIIKDFKEDWQNGRLYWPKVFWSQYVSCPGDFLRPENIDKAVDCLNRMVTNTLQNLPPCFNLISQTKCLVVRRFWTTHLITGIATLDAFFNNPEVFTKSVKIPRTEAARLLLCTSSRSEVKENFHYFTSKIMTRADQENCKSAETRRVCLNILKQLDTLTSDISEPRRRRVPFWYMLPAVVVLLVSAIVWFLVS